jgi:hypothetical protein
MLCTHIILMPFVRAELAYASHHAPCMCIVQIVLQTSATKTLAVPNSAAMCRAYAVMPSTSNVGVHVFRKPSALRKKLRPLPHCTPGRSCKQTRLRGRPAWHRCAKRATNCAAALAPLTTSFLHSRLENLHQSETWHLRHRATRLAPPFPASLPMTKEPLAQHLLATALTPPMCTQHAAAHHFWSL